MAEDKTGSAEIGGAVQGIQWGKVASIWILEDKCSREICCYEEQLLASPIMLTQVQVKGDNYFSSVSSSSSDDEVSAKKSNSFLMGNLPF